MIRKQERESSVWKRLGDVRCRLTIGTKLVALLNNIETVVCVVGFSKKIGEVIVEPYSGDDDDNKQIEMQYHLNDDDIVVVL